MGQYVDKRILDKIYELASHNVTNVTEVRLCLDRYVENEVYGDVADAKKPKKTNRRYFPSRKDLRNHIARAISAQKYCDDDQESLRLKKVKVIVKFTRREARNEFYSKRKSVAGRKASTFDSFKEHDLAGAEKKCTLESP